MKKKTNNLTTPFHYTATFGDKSIEVLGPHIQNMYNL